MNTDSKKIFIHICIYLKWSDIHNENTHGNHSDTANVGSQIHWNRCLLTGLYGFTMVKKKCDIIS